MPGESPVLGSPLKVLWDAHPQRVGLQPLGDSSKALLPHGTRLICCHWLQRRRHLACNKGPRHALQDTEALSDPSLEANRSMAPSMLLHMPAA